MKKQRIFICAFLVMLISAILILINNKSYGFMIEQKPNSSLYDESENDEFPNADKLNNTKSSCLHGASITHDLETGEMLITGDQADSCTFYYDKTSLANYIISLHEDDESNGLYYHNKNGNDNQYKLNDDSYRYAGADYDLTEKASGEGYQKVATVYDGTSFDFLNGVIKFFCNGSEETIGSTCRSSNYYYKLGYKEDQYETLGDAIEEAIKD